MLERDEELAALSAAVAAAAAGHGALVLVEGPAGIGLEEAAALTGMVPHNEAIDVMNALDRYNIFLPAGDAEARYDVRRWREYPDGGHFAALEVPEILAADVREFFV